MYGNNIYGKIEYAQNILTDSDIQAYTPDLMQSLPEFYRGTLLEQLESSSAKEIGLINYNLDDLQNQLFVTTATWGLNCWEQYFNIETDLNKSYEERREIIKAKLRGTATATKAMIQNMAEAFSGGEVKIIEAPNDYSFLVQFIGVKGIPKNLGALKDAIDSVKPAHLSYGFKYTYTVWNFINNKQWNNLNNTTWNNLKTYEG